MGDLLGGGSSSSGGNPLSSLGNSLNSLFGGSAGATTAGAAPSDLSSTLSSVADALNPVSQANAAEQAFDPTGSIGAQETINPPSAGTAADQQSSVGGTQSGGAPQQNQPPTQQNQQYAPPDAVAGLKKALQALAQGGGQQNPYQLPAAQNTQGLRQAMGAGQPAPQAPLPALQPGETGAQSPQPSSAESEGIQRAGRMTAGLPTGAPAASPLSPTDPAEASLPPDGGPTGDGTVATNAEGQPVTAAGTPASQTPLPPGRPTPTGPSTTGGQPTPTKDDQGRDLVVRAKGQPAAAPDADLPTKVPLPTKKPGVLPTKKPGAAPNFPPEPGPIMRDVTGGQGVPPALAQLAQGALGMLLPMLLSGGFGGGGRRGGRGGFRHFGGFHHGGEGHWPYHHPMRGWQMHDHHPGGGWMPLHPHHMRGMMQDRSMSGGNDQASQIMQAIFGNSQQGQDNQRQAGGGQDGNQAPPDQTQYDASKVPMGSTDRGTPGVSASQYDGFARDYAQQIGLDPDVVSRVLATESSFGQNIYGDYENGRPTSFGGFQLHLSPDGKAMGNQYMRDTGHAPWDHKYWQEQVKYALDHMKKGGLGPWKTTMNKLGYGVWSASKASPNREATAPTPATTPAPQASVPADAGAG